MQPHRSCIRQPRLPTLPLPAPGGRTRRRALHRLGGTARRPLLRRPWRRRRPRRAPRLPRRQASRPAERPLRAPEGWRWGELPAPAFRGGIFPYADPGGAPLEPQWPLQQVPAQQALPLPRPEGGGRDARSSAASSPRADVLLDNYRPSRPRPSRLRLRGRSPPSTRASCASPCRATASTGPYRERGSWGPILEAHTGLAASTGYEDGGPVKQGAAFPDGIGGLTGAFVDPRRPPRARPHRQSRLREPLAVRVVPLHRRRDARCRLGQR